MYFCLMAGSDPHLVSITGFIGPLMIHWSEIISCLESFSSFFLMKNFCELILGDQPCACVMPRRTVWSQTAEYLYKCKATLCYGKGQMPLLKSEGTS